MEGLFIQEKIKRIVKMDNTQMILGALQEFQQYTTRRLDKMESAINATLTQATKTNGRVNNAEADIIAIQNQMSVDKKRSLEVKDKWIWGLLGGLGSLILSVIAAAMMKKFNL